MKDLYVGNLEWNTTENELTEIFRSYGEIKSTKIIRDYHTKKSKGYAFIDMENADKAMKELDGKELRGRTLKINYARQNQKRHY